MKKVISLLIILMLLGCKKDNLPEPTKNFYVNDYADALMTYTEVEIASYNRYLYEELGEVQIVYATFLIENDDEMLKVDKTALYRKWGIGKNDKGLLVMLFYKQTYIDDIESRELVGYGYEVGYHLEYLFTPIYMNNTLKILFSDEYYGIADMTVVHLNFELLNRVYTLVYDMTPIDYNLDEYFDELLNAPYIPPDDSPDGWDLLYILGNYPVIYAVLFGVLTIGGGLFFKIRGGGGSSGGAGLFKKRR
jgi:uncharacterized protein